jgi:hypothetical protein
VRTDPSRCGAAGPDPRPGRRRPGALIARVLTIAARQARWYFPAPEGSTALDGKTKSFITDFRYAG